MIFPHWPTSFINIAIINKTPFPIQWKSPHYGTHYRNGSSTYRGAKSPQLIQDPNWGLLRCARIASDHEQNWALNEDITWTECPKKVEWFELWRRYRYLFILSLRVITLTSFKIWSDLCALAWSSTQWTKFFLWIRNIRQQPRFYNITLSST